MPRIQADDAAQFSVALELKALIMTKDQVRGPTWLGPLEHIPRIEQENLKQISFTIFFEGPYFEGIHKRTILSDAE